MGIDYSDLESLLAPIDDRTTCGVNLEYSEAFLELEREVRGKAAIELGAHRVPARLPDWWRVASIAIALFDQTKDLRVAVAFLRALLAKEGLPGLARGLYVLNGLVRRYWGCLFPELEDEDPTARVNVLAALSDRTGVLKQLRDTTVTYTTRGEITVGDLTDYQDETTRAALTTADREALETGLLAVRQDYRVLDATADCGRWLDELRRILENTSMEAAAALDGLTALIDRLRGWFRAREEARPGSTAGASLSSHWVGGRPGVFIESDATPSPEAGPYFKIYRPNAVSPETWSPFLVYLHSGATSAVDTDSRQRLGSAHSSYAVDDEIARVSIARGVEVTVVPTVPGCRFNPRQQRVEWVEDIHCVEFRLQASPKIAGFKEGSALRGHVRLYAGPLLIGEIPTTIVASREMAGYVPLPTEGAVGAPLSRVFVSYAHEDAVIVELLQQTYELVRIEYLRDVSVLRAGDRWSTRILEQIDRANRFQLCWSAAARHSRYVEQEWRHALAIRTAKEDTFICPFYWQKPMPAPPPELADLHFAYLQLET